MVSTLSSGPFHSFSTAALWVNFFYVTVCLAPEGIWLVVSIQGKTENHISNRNLEENLLN